MTPARSALVFHVLELACALPLETVVETMRPLPVQPLAAMPRFVVGISVIRGSPTVVIDAGLLLGTRPSSAGRVVTVRTAHRTVALVVDRVAGIRHIASDSLERLPPLLERVAGDAIEAIGRVDHELLLALRGARLVPDEVLAAIAGATS